VGFDKRRSVYLPGSFNNLLESQQTQCLVGYGIALGLIVSSFAKHSKSMTQIGRHELQNRYLLWLVADLSVCLSVRPLRKMFASCLLHSQSWRIIGPHL
jgi:hypothetical protein